MSVSKMIMGQAANQYVTPTYVENLFSTYLYDGNSSTQTITNGIDLSGEGGLVWIKRRDGNLNHALFDTARGAGAYIASNLTAGHYTGGDDLTDFNSNGFTLGDGQFTSINYNSYDYVSWTFRKKAKFFDVVTYTGDGVAGRTISHNLGSVPGMIIVKRTDTANYWAVWHRKLNGGTNSGQYWIRLDSRDAETTNSGMWNNTEPTATEFTVGGSGTTNTGTYVAYLFAHNDGDGDFGVTNDQDIIKCGSYTGNASGTGPEINLGFEPQWLFVKNADNASADWLLLDVMRGWGMGDADIFLEPNQALGDQGSQNWGQMFLRQQLS